MVDLKDELQIFEDCFAQIKEIEPTFKMKLVVCGLKIFGDEHINAQIKACLKGMKTTTLISGFDLVNEEDTTPPLRAFRKMIKNTQQENPGFEIFLHAGESASRKNSNLYDAVLLNTKRLGHAFHLIDHPYLIEKVKERGICVEVCPVSNLILGYCYDLRWHPARSFLQRGIPMCINSDDPGFWGSTGVSLDFAYATIAWDLDLKELKQFAINAIKYSTLVEADKEEVFNRFYDGWNEWILSMAK